MDSLEIREIVEYVLSSSNEEVYFGNDDRWGKLNLSHTKKAIDSGDITQQQALEFWHKLYDLIVEFQGT